MREIHEGSCGNHFGVRSLPQKIARQGYFWPTMIKDAKDFVKKCESYQRYASLIHQPATPLEPIKIACPCDQWGIDIVGPFSPGSEPRILISDNGTQFQGKNITEWCKELKIAQLFTAVANPQANGQTEVTNRTILQYLKTHLEAKGSWVEDLPGVLWLIALPHELQQVQASRHVGKLNSSWEEPYKVAEIKKKGTYKLQDMQGQNLPQPWNIQNLKKFYA
ncbi:UNVERIFIED_CONTAM: hypothetical protein Sindi_1271700 [Sesamum indicum]